MNAVGIKELQADIGKLTSCFEHDECTLITRKGKPIGFALSFSAALVQNGLKSWLAIKAKVTMLIKNIMNCKAIRQHFIEFFAGQDFQLLLCLLL